MERFYGADPFLVATIPLECREMLFYQYLPIKMDGENGITMERRLKVFRPLIDAAIKDYIQEYGIEKYADQIIYLTVKHLFQTPTSTFNRLGWHTDGFLTPDVNYIWSDSVPTLFSRTKFNLTPDDQLSMVEMEQQECVDDRYTFPNNSLVRLDQWVVHSVQQPTEVALRTFVKVSFSQDRYDLEGNSHNYEMDYNWPMRKRGEARNVPQKLEVDG